MSDSRDPRKGHRYRASFSILITTEDRTVQSGDHIYCDNWESASSYAIDKSCSNYKYSVQHLVDRFSLKVYRGEADFKEDKSDRRSH